MASEGFFGGLASGISDAQTQAIARAQQQNQSRANAQKQINDTITHISETAKALVASGRDPGQNMGLFQPLIESADELASSPQMEGFFPKGYVPRMAGMIIASNKLPVLPNLPGTSAPASAPAPSQPASSADIPNTPTTTIPSLGGSLNLTGPDRAVTGVQYGPVENAATPPTPAAPSDVDKWTRVMMAMPSGATSTQKAAVAARLKDAISQQTDNLDVKVLKDPVAGDHVVFVDKANKKVFGPDGTPYITPQPDSEDDPIGSIAKAIESGEQPPVTTGLYRSAVAVKAKLAKDGFDLSSANLQWQSAQKQVAALNGSQMTRYAGLANSVVNTINEVNDLAKQMDNSGIPLLNRAKLTAYMQTEGNSPKGQLAARYLASINTLKEEFANLAQGGFAPTEAAWSLANQQINGDYGVKQLGASLTEVQRLIRYRLQGIPNFQSLGPPAANRYTGAVTSPTAPPPEPPAKEIHTYITPSGGKFKVIQ